MQLWKFIFPAMLLPALFYISWDVWFTNLGVWSFNPAYITGLHLINLPVEEVLFFFVVPYCCIFIYACLKSYFPGIKNTLISQSLFIFIALLIIVIGFFHLQQRYTAYTFMACGTFMIIIYGMRGTFFSGFNFSLFLLSYTVILIPFLLVNGFLTAIPVVLYNDAENLGIKIYTIPVEDIFYGMLLILLNLVIYEKLQQRFLIREKKK